MKDHIISIMILAPFIGAVLQTVAGASARWIAMASSLISSICGFGLILTMPADVKTHAVELFQWMGAYNITYAVGIDGLNVLLVLLVSFVFPFLLLYEWRQERGTRGLHGLYLILQSSTVGLICAQDMFLIFFFWALTCLPFYFLLSIWGEKNRESAAFRFLVSASIGNAFFFAALLLVYFSVEPHTFSLKELSAAANNGSGKNPFILLFGEQFSMSKLAFLFTALAVAFRIPIWPIHGWFSFVLRQASASLIVVFCGVFIPVATYVFYRLGYSLFPAEMHEYGDILIFIGGLNVIFGALGAVAQRDLSLLLGFVSLFQVGLLLLGIGSLESPGVVGTVYQQLVVGLGLAGFGLFVGVIRERIGMHDFLDEKRKPLYGGLASQTPFLALVAGVLLASLLGFPGLGGFVGQSMIFMGGYTIHPMMIILMGIGTVLLTYGLFTAYRFVFLGPSRSENIKDLSLREKGFLLPFIVLLFVLGIYPKPLLDLVRPSVLELLANMK